MLYFWLILVALVLFFGFLALTAFERKKGTRVVFGEARAVLDTHTSRAFKVLTTADPLDFLVRGARTLFGHVFHDLANVLWATVRMLERTLATVVHKLQGMRHHTPKKEASVEERVEGEVG